MNLDKIFQIIVFVIVVSVVILFLCLEKRDLTCGNEGAEICGKGFSMATFPGIPHKKDSKKDTKQKISFLARYEENTILWRRTALISIIIAFLATYIITKKFPHWKTFLVLVVIIYFVLYMVHILYKPLTSKKAMELIDKNLKNL